MTCSHCNQEYGSNVQVCPQCGRTLVYGAAAGAAAQAPSAAYGAPYTGPGEPTMQTPLSQFDLTTTVSVSGANSIRSRLRPRTVWELFGEAFQLYKDHWKLFSLIAMILYAPLAIIQFFWQQAYEGGIHNLFPQMMRMASLGQAHGHAPQFQEMINQFMHGFVPLMVLTAGFVLVANAESLLSIFALTRAVSDSYLGKKVELREVLVPNQRFWGFVGSMLLCGLIGFAAMVVAVIPLIAAGVFFGVSAGNHSDSMGLAVVLLILSYLLFVFSMIAVYMGMIRFIAVGPVAIVEGKGALESFKRGSALMRGFYWKAVGMLIVAGAAYFLVYLVLSMPYSIAVAMHQAAAQQATGNPFPQTPTYFLAISSCLQLLINTIVSPILLLPVVLFYYDLRIRKEAFDLQMLAEQLGYGMVEQSA